MRGARILLLAMLPGCWGNSSSSVATPAEPAPPNASEPVDDNGVRSLVTSMVVIDACPDSRRLDTKAANREIDELVLPCKTVPGGAAHFSATLLPGGAVELASPMGDPNEGVVPTCLLKQQKQLRHKLRLANACKFDVKLEERSGEQPAS